MPEITLTSKLEAIHSIDGNTNDEKETMVEVSNVSMEFNMASEKLNSLKEYFIALIKHKLFFEKFLALNDVSFKVKRGEVFGILGTNGSGKSTILKIIAGVLEPTKGICRVNGNIAPLIELGAGFDMELSARENIYLNGALLGYSKQFIHQHFDEIVEFAEIEKFLDMPMKNYSSGMIARIAFAIATVIIPDILIVDEVLSVGDFVFQQKCENRISELINQHGVTVLIVSHSNDQIERLCGKAIWIEKGHTRIMGDASKVCNAYRVLGGRTGNSESEQYLFNIMKQIEEDNSMTFIPHHVIKGEDHFELISNIVNNDWPYQPDTIVMVPDYTHVFSIIASGLAGSLNAPILPYNNMQDLPSCIENLLLRLQPKEVIILGQSSNIHVIENRLSSLLSNSRITLLEYEKSIIELEEKVLMYGQAHHLWPVPSLTIVPFGARDTSFAIAIQAFKEHFPVFVQLAEPDAQAEEAEMLTKITGFSNLLAVNNPHIPEHLSSHFEIANIEMNEGVLPTGQDHGNDLLINENASNALVIGSRLDSRWQELIGIPAFLGAIRGDLLLIDDLDLDDIAEGIRQIHAIQPKSTFILKSSTTSDIYIKLLFANKE